MGVFIVFRCKSIKIILCVYYIFVVFLFFS
nr:MAG TPA: hypothetical protein [Caudoviricetes sp.]